MSQDTNAAEPSQDSWITLPNAITVIRLIGSPGLVWFGYQQQAIAMAILAVVLVITEWLDGFLARRMHVTSRAGARLDTISDAVFYSCLLAGAALFIPDRIRPEVSWIIAAIGSYLINWLVSYWRFGCLPSYHTWMAKSAWFLVGPGIVFLAIDWGHWFFRIAMVFVVLTNAEAILISCILRHARVDVPTCWHARSWTRAAQSGKR